MVVVGPGAAVVPMLRRALNGACTPGRRAWPGIGSELSCSASVKGSVLGNAEGSVSGRDEYGMAFRASSSVGWGLDGVSEVGLDLVDEVVLRLRPREVAKALSEELTLVAVRTPS